MDGAFWKGPAEEAIDARGNRALIGFSRTAFCIAVRGHLTTTLSDRIQIVGNRAITEIGKIWICCDWSEMTAYDSRARTDLTRWALDRDRSIHGLHIVVATPIVRMGVSVASMFLKRLTSYETRAAFLRAFDELESGRAGSGAK